MIIDNFIQSITQALFGGHEVPRVIGTEINKLRILIFGKVKSTLFKQGGSISTWLVCQLNSHVNVL